MPAFTQPLRDEHRELLPHLESVKDAAEAVGNVPQEEVRKRVDAALEFLRGHLLVHAQAEEAVLYPEVGKAMGSPRATATMMVDHQMIAHGTGEIAEAASHLPSATPEQLQQLRMSLYAVYAVTRVHFVKEEQVYLPLLDETLTEQSAHEMFEALEAAAAKARQAVTA
jgi:iron-sulfur cluster repair protein YtfE (RIC family)